jgi:hypothetical protein
MAMKTALKAFFVFLSLVAASFLAFRPSAAQEITPRALAPAPVKMHILALSYAYSYGNYLFDASLPIEGVDSKAHSLVLGYSTTLRFFGRGAKLDFVLPMATANWTGLVNGEPASATRTGFGDPMLGITINILGNRALFGRPFFQSRERFVLGAGLAAYLPVGQYDETKLVNLSTHRWVIKTTFGGSFKTGRWIFETILGAWFFTANNSFFNGNTLDQKPLGAVQLNAIYTFRPGLWIAASAAKGWGGETILNGIGKNNTQDNTRFGATLAIPLKAPHSGLRLGWVNGVTSRFGANFTTFAVAYTYVWGGGL